MWRSEALLATSACKYGVNCNAGWSTEEVSCAGGPSGRIQGVLRCVGLLHGCLDPRGPSSSRECVRGLRLASDQSKPPHVGRTEPGSRMTRALDSLLLSRTRVSGRGDDEQGSGDAGPVVASRTVGTEAE